MFNFNWKVNASQYYFSRIPSPHVVPFTKDIFIRFIQDLSLGKKKLTWDAVTMVDQYVHGLLLMKILTWDAVTMVNLYIHGLLLMKILTWDFVTMVNLYVHGLLLMKLLTWDVVTMLDLYVHGLLLMDSFWVSQRNISQKSARQTEKSWGCDRAGCLFAIWSSSCSCIM